MSEPFVYSFDTNQKSRMDDFNEVYPDQDFKGLTDDQIDSLLERFEAEVAAQGVDLDDEAEAPVGAPKPAAGRSLTPAAARALLVADSVKVGARGRLSVEQWARAEELAAK